MRHTHIFIAITAAVLIGGGCATERQTETAVGAGAGAATGAVLGGVVSGSARGTAIGGAIGAGVGAAVGYNWQLVKDKLGIATKDTGLNLTEQADGAVKVNVPGTISFTSGSSTISPKLYPALDKIASTLNEHTDTTVTIIGHSDSAGNAQANRELARRRAEAVATYLTQQGVGRDRIMVESRGDIEPIADNLTEAGRAQNRRVELVIRQIGS